MLTQSQIRFLKGQAHALKPVVMLGEKGLTDAVLAEVEQALAHHQLIKVKIRNEEKAQRQAWAEQMAETLQAQVVQHMGQMVTLYRAGDKPKWVLPKT